MAKLNSAAAAPQAPKYNPITNARRFRNANKVLNAFRPEVKGSQDAEVVKGVLVAVIADLLHLASAKGLDAKAVARLALKQA